MEFTRIGETSSQKIKTPNFLNEKYPLDLTFYTDIPNEQIDIGELQEMAVERVRLLRVLEMASLKIVKNMTIKDMIIDEMTKQNMKYFMPIVRGNADAETRRRDYLSHFILRLCYCHSNELRRWFLARELEFFKLKFFNLHKNEISLFLKKNNLNFSQIEEEEKKLIEVELLNSSVKNIVSTTNIYKVHFTQVLDLVRNRKVFIKCGMAYVPQGDLISLLSSLFRTKLSHALAVCASKISKVQSDERLSRILKGLHTSYTGNDYCTKMKDQISKDRVHAFASKSFPLCMRAMYENFVTTHHLRHMARLQFGLFLKGIGLSLEESLKFWREGFTKKPDVNEEVFEKRYAYSIRHSYGTEGKRANYLPHSCMKIISTTVAPGDNHGCPFKHYDTNSLKQKLLSYNITLADVLAIVEYAAKGHYQLACTKYFEVTHNVTNAKGINHPNLYFEESQNIINGSNKKSDKDGQSESQNSVEWGPETSFDLDLTKIVENAKNITSDN